MRMKFSILCLILLQVIALSNGQTCTQTFSCLHSGKFNSATCKCDCFPNYSGDYCETVNCATADPSACGIYITANQCSGVSIPDYCPSLCNARGCTCSNGIDQCLNGGTFNSNTCTCSCPTGFTGSVCQTVSSCQTQVCQNSGSFNAAACKCDCFANYQGNLCETLDCTVADSPYCVSFSLADCNTVTIVRSYCPNKCGRCLGTTVSTSTSTTTASTSTTTASTSTTTASTSTTTASTSTTTASTSTTSTSTTTASTSTTTASTSTTTASTSTTTASTSTTTASTSTTTASTSTTTASTSTTTASTSTTTASTSTTTASTSTTTASTSTTTASTSTTTASTSTTTASTLTSTASTLTTTVSTTTNTITSCQAINCDNGFVFNANTCTCPCGTGFSGSTCMNYDCTTTPQPDALLFGVCDQLDCAQASVRGTCPHKCFCTTTTAPPTTTVITTTAVATTATTTCSPVTCAYGLIADAATCTCSCRTGFSGTLCENFACNTSPTPDSALGFLCNALTCSNDGERLICPFKCLCGSTVSP